MINEIRQVTKTRMVSVPEAILERFNIKNKDFLRFYEEQNGKITVEGISQEKILKEVGL